MKKTLILLLAMTLCLCFAATACAAALPQEAGETNAPPAPVIGAVAFSDVPAGAWYAPAVAYCREQGIMQGTSDAAFSPDSQLSRAMVATILWRIAGEPASDYDPGFTDAAADTWYSQAVAWAAENKVVEGYGNGLFGVNDGATREQLAAILHRYAGSPAAAATSTATASAWARPAVNWAQGSGLFAGIGNDMRNMTASATRAETAVVLYNYLNPNNTTATCKTLVAYFSCTGNTRAVANHIASASGGDLYEITPETPYTEADLNYRDSSSRSTREQNDPAARPAISGQVEDMSGYDVIFLGYPIWHGQAPRIISAFLESYDFSGKTIVPFCTSGSSGIGSSASNLAVLASDSATWLEGRRFSGGAGADEVKSWLDGLDLPTPAAAQLSYDGVYPQHQPYGKGIGAMPGRVVWAHNTGSVDWDGQGYWWELDNFNNDVILNMVNDGVASLGGAVDAKSGWSALFRAYNGGSGYQAGEKIAIKANINGSGVNDDDTSGETRMSYTNPALLQALLTSLVKEAGVAPADVTVYDVSRLFPDYMKELCTAGALRGVNFVDRSNGAADENAPIEWSHAFSGKVNYLPTCVTEASYVINLANLKGHSYGVTLCAKNHFGSFINGNAMRPPEGANLHQWLTRNEMGIYSPLVDLTANQDLGGKTVLYMLDALICAVSEGSSMTGDNTRWQQAPFNNDYTQSVFFSQDPLAIDSVGADFLMSEPTVIENNGAIHNNPSVENYLHEAALVGDAPSDTAYQDGNGQSVTNLGVHEHWNNSTQKQYSRNLGQDEGIELIYLAE